ncbi:MAG TPA: 50S ribosome-binding protein YggL [Gemmatimonadaceae bacterium]
MSAPCPLFGFVVSIRLRPETTELDADLLADQLIDLLEANSLTTEGGGLDRHLEFVVNREGAQATQSDRELILTWAERWREKAAIAVGDLVDRNEVA